MNDDQLASTFRISPERSLVSWLVERKQVGKSTFRLNCNTHTVRICGLEIIVIVDLWTC